MRQLHIAVLVGALLGVGTLLYDIGQTSSVSLSRTTTSRHTTTEDEGTISGERIARVAGPHAHDDATTEDRQVFLNERVIDGQPTLICIDQQRPAFSRDETAALYRALNDAVVDWERELGLNLFTIIDRRASTASQSCTGTNAPEFDVLIRFGNCTRDRSYACYQDDESEPGEPPRRHFKNQTSTKYSAVVYQGGPEPRPDTLKPHVSTIRHELGHVIGLNDYHDGSCWGLRVRSVPTMPPVPLGPAQSFVARDVDRYDNHVSLMLTNGRAMCRSTDISYRDKRDFYEAYQPGALDGVSVSLTKKEGSTPKSLSVRWTLSGMEDLEHNGTHIAVIGRHPTIAAHQAWKVLKAVKLRNRRGDAMTALTLPDDANVDRKEFRVVGLTKGNLRTQGSVIWADPLPSSRATGLGISGTQWLMGDPAYVFGEVWNPDTPQVYVSGSFGSTAACYIAGPGAMKDLTFKWFVYSNTTSPEFSSRNEFEIRFNNHTYTRHVPQLAGETKIGCDSLPTGSGVDRNYLLSVKVTGGTILDEEPLTASGNVRVQKRNHDRTLRFSTPLTASPSTCVSGQTVTVRWALASNSLPATIRLNGVEATSSPATFTCPSEPAGDRNRVYVSALAEDGSGEVVPVTIQAPAPTGVTASTSVTTNAATATLTWNAVPGAASYGLWRSGATSNSSTTNTRHTFERLNPYQAYNLYVWTVNSAGARSANVVKQVTLGARPGVPRTAAPTGLASSGITTTSATLSWNAVPGATSYRVWRSNGQRVTLSSTARSYTFTGLLPSRNYTLMVWAIGNGGLSPYARVGIHTLGPKPATPTGLRPTTSVTATTGTATLTWNAVSGAASYGLWRSGGQNVTTTSTSYTFRNLLPYETYNLYVWAVDSAGRKSTNARASITMPQRPGVARPGSPTGVTTSGLTSSSVTLNWSAGTGVSKYAVWRSNGGSTVRLASSARSYTFRNLTPSTHYTLMVWAEGAGGVSVSKRVSVTTSAPPAPPSAPTGLSASRAATTTVMLRWNAAAGATSYKVKRSGSSRVWTVPSGRTYYTFRGLRAGTSYTLYVQAKNNNGSSAWVSEPSVTVPPWPGVPGIERTHNSLKLTWSSVRGATGYEVKRGYYGTVQTVAPGKTSHTFGGLTSGWSYTLYVRATNAGGKSRWRSQTDTTLLPDPTGVRVSGKTSSSLTLSWTPDSRAIWYQVKRVPGHSATTISESSYTFRGLNANTSYTLYVRVWGGGGWSGWSSTSARTSAASTSTPTRSSLAACLNTTTLDTYASWTSTDSHCGNGGSASALWSDLKAAGVAVGCISHWNNSTRSFDRYQSGGGWSSFRIAYGAILWLNSIGCAAAGGASGASGASAADPPGCADAVQPSSGATAVRVGGSACVIVVGGGAVRVSDGTRTLNLTLSTGRDWLVLAASDFTGSDAGAFQFMDLSSGGWLALDPSDGGELTRYVPTSAAGLSALLDAIVNSASAQ